MVSQQIPMKSPFSNWYLSPTSMTLGYAFLKNPQFMSAQIFLYIISFDCCLLWNNHSFSIKRGFEMEMGDSHMC